MVNLNQFGGEGVPSYKGNKNDMSLKQLGGEGNKLSTKGTDVAYTPGTPKEEYCGPGRYLKTESD